MTDTTGDRNPMNLIKRSDPDELTDDEMSFLRSTSCSPEVRAAIAGQRRDRTGIETRAYRKVAAKARAEAEAILAVRQLDALRGDGATVDQALAAVERERSARRTAEAERDRLQNRLTREIAAPATAVHSDD